jgi:hypothetical protein
MKACAAPGNVKSSVVSCGGDDSGGSVTTPPPSTPPVTTTRLIQEGTFVLNAPADSDAFFGLTEVTTTASGTWEATLASAEYSRRRRWNANPHHRAANGCGRPRPEKSSIWSQ